MNKAFLPLRALAIVALLLCSALPGMAQTNYVFYNADYGYLYNDNGTLRSSASLQFNKSSAWTAAGTLGNTNRTITPYNVANLYLRTSTNNGGTVSLNATSSNWQMRYNLLCVRSGGTNYYLRTTNGTSFTTQNNTSGAYYPYAVTISEEEEVLTDISINSGSASISATGNYTYGHTNANYTPAYINYRFSNTDHYVGADNSTLANVAPQAVTTGYTWSLSSNATGYATLVGNELRVTALPEYDIVLTLTCSLTYEGITKTATKEILLQGTTVAAPTLTRSGNSVTLETATIGATIYYTTDGSTPSSSSTAYSGPIDIAGLTFPVTVKAIAIRSGNSSDPASATYSQPACEVPVITVGSGGVVTITCATEGATIRITYGDSPADPTGSSPAFTSLTLSQGQVVKAIATKSGYDNSAVASAEYLETGISGTTVVLDDREDHTWSYYGTKPDSYYPDQLLSPDPRNVKITYDGNGAEVSYNESQNEFVYYKTIEKVGGTYTYKVIPNPFSKRPTVGAGNTRWRGFGGWKIISGAEYISGHNNNDVLDLEETLTLTGLDAGYTPNCLSATIELQATWVQAYVSTVDAAGGITSRPNTLTGDTYETNFIVILDNNAHAVSGTGRVTISNRYPDGSAGGNGTVNGCTTAADGTKVEFTNISGTFTETSGPLMVGRGCTGTVGEVTGANTNRVKNIRLESGTYSFVHPMQGLGDNAANRGNFVFGCDYDRANITDARPYGDNTKLRIVVFTSLNGAGGHANDNTDDLQNITVKSGYYGFTSDFASWQSDKSDGWGLGIGGNTDNFGDNYVVPDETGTMRTYTYGTKPPRNTMSFYVGPTRGGGKGGKNYLRIEGGELSSINGGGTTTPDDFIRFDFRMTGGWVKGAVYGGASATDCYGSSKIVITGGEVNSWIGGGCNGTDIQAGAGATNGTIYIYAGGNAQIRSHNSDGVYNNAWGLVNHIEGGQIYGGGRGMGAAGSYSGSATNAFVVVADEAFVEQNVYGGSCHGVSQYGYVYILGGTVGKKVFGGSFEPTSTNSTWQARNTYVRMYGGLVKGGLYGGNDESGTVTQNAEVLVLGGQVGADADHPGYVFGGGYGENTAVNGNITVTLGQADATDSATVYGNVYGGSALGSVNTNTSNTTVVTMHKGLVNGNLFGGALGQASPLIDAPVNGLITVNIRGGRVNGSVFGGGDVAPYGRNGQNYPVVNMTGGTVTDLFGGGKGSTAAVTGNPQVNLSGKARVTHNVYGGGDQAAVTGNPNVILR